NLYLEGENQEALDNFEPPPDFLFVDCSGISRPGTYILRVESGEAEDIILRTDPNEVSILISLATEDDNP
ncbi:MAG: hypothetical protein FWH35_10100, partial [Treponema sp.]|nr:hypothetical protein [Treponema sp.]